MILSPRDALLLSSASLTPELAARNVPLWPSLIQEVSLRDYQLDLILRALALMRQGFRRVLIQLPTGGGKTVMAAALLNSTSRLAVPAQFIVHRKELIDQTSASFDERRLSHGFVASGRPFDPGALVLLAGVQTLVNRLDLVLPPNLIILDEAHHATAGTWETVLAAYPDAYVIGLSATPERLDGRGLGEQFDVMVQGPPVAWLIEREYLSPYTYYAPTVPDMSGVDTVAGDFSRSGAAAVMDRPKIIGDVVDHYRRLAPGQRGIVFAVNREHSRNLAAAFQGAGIRAAHVDGDSKDRDEVMQSYRDGVLDIMTNVDLFGEGLDVPGIVYVGLARPTKSLSLFLQQVGRGLRPVSGKREAILCDHAGNAFIHGLPDDERTWSLDGRKARPRSSNDDATPIRQCLECFRVAPSRLAVCPGCGVAFQKTAREIEIEEGQLTKLERDRLKKESAAQRKAEEKACRSWDAFKVLGEQRGYPDPGKWASAQMLMRKRYRERFRRG